MVRACMGSQEEKVPCEIYRQRVLNRSKRRCSRVRDGFAEIRTPSGG
ncbi:MAG: hypothetical protein HOH76_07655 [Hellea sp.]|nr:hypothetical protein [Hellea sp.]